MLALIVTWITRNCSSWLEFGAGFWFLIDFVRHFKGVYTGLVVLAWDWNEPLFCLSFTNCYNPPPPAAGGTEKSGGSTLSNESFHCNSLALSFNNGSSIARTMQCFGQRPHPALWLPSKCPYLELSSHQHLKCKDQTEARMTKCLHCFSPIKTQTVDTQLSFQTQTWIPWYVAMGYIGGNYSFQVNNYFKLNCHFSEHKF